jgi:hypothetical protein
MKKKFTHVLDFCFKVESPSADYTTIPRDVLLKALKDRIKRIEESGEDTGISLVDVDDGA